MELFIPFIHEKKEKFEPLPLYIELIPLPINNESDKDDEKESNIIIIELL